MKGGEALGAALFGQTNAFGRLPYTVYHAEWVNQTSMLQHDLTRDGGRTYRYYRGEPLLRFGFGLSLSDWCLALSQPPVQPLQFTTAAVSSREGQNITVRASNTGRYAGDCVVMCFFRPVNLPTQPRNVLLKQLIGFERISNVSARASREVSFSLNLLSLALTDASLSDTGDTIVAPGEYELIITDGSETEGGTVRLNVTVHGDERVVEPFPSKKPLGHDVRLKNDDLKADDEKQQQHRPVTEIFPTDYHEPSLVLVPPATLIAVAETGDFNHTGTLAMRRSVDGGEHWGPLMHPIPTPEPPFGTQSQLLWDARRKQVLWQFSKKQAVVGGCDSGVQDIWGVLQVTSTNAGLSWSRPVNISRAAKVKPVCGLAPTSGAGAQLQTGPHAGRLLFSATHNSYLGDVILYSDDGGVSYEASYDLAVSGLDESQMTQLSNGTLMIILRNCLNGTAPGTSCPLMSRSMELASPGSLLPPGWPTKFMYSLSHDSGVHWTVPRVHPDLITPVCQSSILTHKNATYFAGPIPNPCTPTHCGRYNLTILGSDDNGATFPRRLLLGNKSGIAGYTGFQCGLEGREDCAVIFDNYQGIQLVRFSSRDVV